MVKSDRIADSDAVVKNQLKINLLIIVSKIFAVVCLILFILVTNPLLVNADVAPEIEQAYQEAIKDAEVPEYSEIYKNLTAITEDNPNLVWEGVPEKSRLKVAQWTNHKYTLNKDEPQKVDIWVTVVPELKNFCTQYVNAGGKDLSLRLKQLLGLNPNWEYSKVVEMWVDPKFLFRPSPDPEISDQEAGLTSPFSDRFLKVKEKHQLWLNAKRNNSFRKDATGKYDDNAQPWTALGYTYDWGNPQTEVGLSEFVIEGNPEQLAELSSVEVISITPTVQYCMPSNIADIDNNITGTDNITNTETPDKNNGVLNNSKSTFKSSTNTMLIPNVLNIAINLFFIYLIVSLLLSALQEQIVVLFALRARNLKSSIKILLGEKQTIGEKQTKLSKENTITDNLFQSPLIASLNQQGNIKLKKVINKITQWDSVGPSYLKSITFSDALLELLRKDYGFNFKTYSDGLNQIIEQLETELDNREESSSKLSKLPKELLENLYTLARQSKTKVDQGEGTLKEFQENIANWFDESMERATGVYKRNAFGLSLLLAFIIALVGNIDTLYITNQLYNDPALNETLSGLVTQEVNTIQSQCQDLSEQKKSQCIQKAFNDIKVNDIHSFPIGWEIKTDKSSFFNYDIHFKKQQSILFAIFGWSITAIALAQGAPFWFDLLNNVVNIRLAGKRYDSSNEKPKKGKK